MASCMLRKCSVSCKMCSGEAGGKYNRIHVEIEALTNSFTIIHLRAQHIFKSSNHRPLGVYYNGLVYAYHINQH